MSQSFKALVSASLYLFSILFFFNVNALADDSSLNSTPAYWRNMIHSLPYEEVPEAMFKDREFSGSEATTLLKQALVSFHNNKYSTAVKQLTDIVVRFPNDEITPYANFIIGDCYSRMWPEDSKEVLKDSIKQYLNSVTSYPTSDEAPRGLYQAARGLFARGFYYEAIAQLERIALRYPKSEYVQKRLIAKGILYFYQQKYSFAESTFRKMVNSDGVSDEDKKLGKLWLANALHMAGRYAEAKELYRMLEVRSSDDMKNNSLFVLMMSENLMNLGEYGNGKAMFLKFSSLSHDSPVAAAVALRTADAFRLEGRKEEALGLYEKVVALYPAGEAALIGKARAAEAEIENGKVASAEKLLQHLLLTKGEVAREAALIIADALRKSGLSPNAAKAYRAITNLGTAKDGQLQENLVESLKGTVTGLYREKDYLSILKLYHEELRLLKGVKDPHFLKMIAHSYLEVGLSSEAASIYDGLFSLTQGVKSLTGGALEEAIFYACEAYLRAGRKSDAEKAINRLLTEFPKTRFKEGLNRMKGKVNGKAAQDGTAKGYLTDAMGRLSEKKYNEAAEFYNKVISMKDPLFLASAYVGLGDSYFAIGKYKEAINAYDTAKETGGEKGFWAAYRIGESYLNLGDVETAQESFKSVVAGDKGIYKKMAVEELKRIDMNKRNPGRID